MEYPKEYLGKVNVKCNSCAYHSCLKCFNKAHRPLSCMTYSEWYDLSSGASEKLSKILIEASTKACPKCKVRWGPPVACLHVTCHTDKGGCGYEWCWLCK